MKLFVIFVLVILLIILVLNRRNELFMDKQLKSKIIKGIALNMGEIENLDSLILKAVPNSEKLLIENIIKTHSVKNLIFSKNLKLLNYSNNLQTNLQNGNPNKLELFYERDPLENIHNLPIAFSVGPDFKTNSKNPYYGFQFRYKITDGSLANRAEVGIEFKSYMDLKLGKLIKMISKFDDEDYKKNINRERVEIMAQETKKFQFLPYFRDGNIKAIALFKDGKNKEFLQETEGYFNLNDERGNRILTKCKLDTPYCNTHLPQKGKIYGRDQYIASKFYPYDDNFRVIVRDDIDEAELMKIREQMEKEKQQNEINGINGQNIPNVPRWGSCKSSDECDGDDLYCRVGDKRCLTDEDCLWVKEKEGGNLNCDRIEKTKDTGVILGPDGVIIGLNGQLKGLALSYYNYCSNTKKPGAFIEKKLFKSKISIDWSESNIVNLKSNYVYLLFNGFIRAPKTGNVIFRTSSDDGIKININGETELFNEEGSIVNSWLVQVPTSYTTKPISMKKNMYYNLKLEYFENTVAAVVKLEWKWDGDADFQLVPEDVFFTTSKLLDTKSEEKSRTKNIKYEGCYKNEGDRRIPNHLRSADGDAFNFTIDKCSNSSSVLFGMEHPLGYDEENTAECLVLNEIPDLEKVDDNECAVELDSSGRKLGAINRLAVYSNTDCYNQQSSNNGQRLNGNSENSEPKIRNGVVATLEWIALPDRNIPRNSSIKLIDDTRKLDGSGLHLQLENKDGRDVSDYVTAIANFDNGTLLGDPYNQQWPERIAQWGGYGYRVGDLLVAYDKPAPGGKIMTQNRDKFIFKVTSVKDNITEDFVGGIVNEGFIGDFEDTSGLPQKDQPPPFHDYYQKYLTKKDCLKEKIDLKERIKNNFYLEEDEIDLVEKKEKLEPLRRLRGLNCIKHFDEYRDDYFFGGLDSNNNMMCYGKDEECILFPNKEKCDKMGLETLLSIPEEDIVKGLKYDETRPTYDEETIKMLQDRLSAEIEEKDDGFEVKCGKGKYLEGTFNPEDEIQIVGGYYKDCTDPQHPDHDNCPEGPSPSTSYHLSELITTKGRKKYNKNKKGKYSNFGDLDGKCIDNNIPDGRMDNCDPLDDFQPCYVGKRPSLVPGESVENTDIYNKFLGYNCHTYTLDTNTCKHNNNGVLSDIISFSSPLENNYLDLINNQELLEISTEYDMDMLSDEEKYLANNSFMFMEKYFEKYEDMNPSKYFNLRYKLKFETYYDLITKKNEIILNIYHQEKLEASLHNNQGELHFLTDGDMIEILITKDNLVLFKIVNPATKLILAQYTSKNKIEGDFGSEINFYISQNNNSFIRDIKYKEEIPKTVLPYNPFVNITQI